MQYLNLDLNYFDHPKTVRLVGLLGRGAEILPVRLWVYAAKYLAETGEFIGFSPQEIESIARWWGKSGEMVDAMIQAQDEKGLGFLEKTDRGYRLPNWSKINGHISALKERAQAGAKARWDKYRDASGNAKAMLKQCSNQLTNQKKKEKGGVSFEVPEDLKQDSEIITTWMKYKAEKGQSYKPTGLEQFWKRLREIPAARRKSAIEHSMANNWSGVFEPKTAINIKPLQQEPKPYVPTGAKELAYLAKVRQEANQ